jgi:hypothetical protein
VDTGLAADGAPAVVVVDAAAVAVAVVAFADIAGSSALPAARSRAGSRINAAGTSRSRPLGRVEMSDSSSDVSQASSWRNEDERFDIVDLVPAAATADDGSSRLLLPPQPRRQSLVQPQIIGPDSQSQSFGRDTNSMALCQDYPHFCRGLLRFAASARGQARPTATNLGHTLSLWFVSKSFANLAQQGFATLGRLGPRLFLVSNR